ncbi:hypothetical protein FRC00_002121 [Tulasnella sp. 408]|nr:hypothetical protein FRC00_002121 [Tulasnella sp. 408]
MNPATPAAVESAVNILLQSISDENRNVLEANSSRKLPRRRPDNETQTGLLEHVDKYARAIKSTLEKVQSQLFAKMSALHTEHNKMIPFHRLPIELFARIITEALKPLQNLRLSRPTYLGRLVTLCQVSKQWRDVINGTASLWASIDFLDPTAITSAAISRAAGYPLNIIAVPPGPISVASRAPDGLEEFTNTAMALSTRWRSIQIVVPSSETALAIMNTPAPLLQSLELKSITKCRLQFEEGAILFQGTGPQLRGLGLHGVAIPWDSYLLRDLRYISISNMEELSPSRTEILGILRACPGLVELELSLEPAGGRKKETPFTLTELRSLSLSLSTRSTFKLLKPIHLPSIQSVNLNLDSNSDDYHSPSLMEHMQTRFSNVFTASYTLLITFFGVNELSCTCKFSGNLCAGKEFKITVEGQEAMATLQGLFDTVFWRFQPEFTELYFDRPLDLDLSTVLSMFDGNNGVKNIMASKCDLNPLLTYVSGSTGYDDWGFPRLEGITIYDCEYNPSDLLRMVEARYGIEEDTGSDISHDGPGLPPPLKWIIINHAPGEADEDILGQIKDILGPDCFEFEETVER